jgi:hypothetical protein
VHPTFIDLKKAYDSVSRKLLYNILIEFRFPIKLVSLIKFYLTETYIRVRVGKRMFDKYIVRNDLEKEML